MNKTTGATLSILALAALLFRTPGFVSTGHEPSGNRPAAASRQAGKKVTGEGPWNASCEYWAPARPAVEATSEAGNAAAAASEEGTSECGDDLLGRWGLPGAEIKPDIHALIAIVPDPARTNMALQFDRMMDALMAAAGDNGYFSSYYWLPWKEQAIRVKDLVEGGGERGENSTGSDDEPGLIILKHVPGPSEKESDSFTPEHFNHVVYLFLVGETPTTGINGFQIQKAFRYQDELAAANVEFGRSITNQPDTLAIIGPTFTGSAASLRQAIDTMLSKHPGITSVFVSGVTGTDFAGRQLNNEEARQKIQYRSFAYDAGFDQDRLLDLLCESSSSLNPIRVAFLVEDGTSFGDASARHIEVKTSSRKCTANRDSGSMLQIRFPREISLLRNAQAANKQTTGGGESTDAAGQPPSPYLRFSLKDSNTYDSVPHLSRENTPLSQEAQLMTIAHQLLRYHAQYIVISGSNVLDAIFLAQFLHRACPDARLVFYVGDLLFEREVDNVPFIGSLTLTPYPLITSGVTAGSSWRRAYPDSNTQGYFNAASYIFWDDPSRSGNQSDTNAFPKLAGYRNSLDREEKKAPPLWVTAIGSDGYYPLGVASPQAETKGDPAILPKLPVPSQGVPLPVAPGRAWGFLCVLVIVVCLFHIVSIWSADVWSPFTRELAISQNDQPRRRAMYVNIATAVLFCMAFVIALPPWATIRTAQPDLASMILSGATMLIGFATAVATISRIGKYVGWTSISRQPGMSGLLHQQHLYFFFNVIAWGTMLSVPLFWSYLCFNDGSPILIPGVFNVGLFFSFRCVHAWSDVSPLMPVLLLLFSWYLWAFFSTWRLRFSDNSRPMLPRRLNLGTTYPLFIADDDLCSCADARDSCLYKNITCLLITREVLGRFIKPLRRFGPQGEKLFDGAIILGYLAVFAMFVFFIPVRSLDTFFWATKGLPTPYEFLVTALFFPLLFIALSAWLRLILVWGSLRRGLLQRLENLPIRYAFSRLRGSGWMAMLRQGGMHEQWRDMARSTESMRQMVNDPDLEEFIANNGKADAAEENGSPAPVNKADQGPAPSRWFRWGWHSETVAPSVVTRPVNPLRTIQDRLNVYIKALLEHIGGTQPDPDVLHAARCLSGSADLPVADNDIGVVLMHAVDKSYAEFSEVLLERVLVPYWTAKRSTLVESNETEVTSEGEHSEGSGHEPQSKSGNDPAYIRVAEEFLAIRYLSLIRVVLVNMRYLLLFVCASFVLAIVAWNSYPFQPRQFIDLVFTCMLALLGCGVIWVFAQMHRDPILSRITHTKPNELGMEFYARIIAFGAVPVLTWVAYQFPGVGSTIFKFLQPGLEVVK